MLGAGALALVAGINVPVIVAQTGGGPAGGPGSGAPGGPAPGGAAGAGQTEEQKKDRDKLDRDRTGLGGDRGDKGYVNKDKECCEGETIVIDQPFSAIQGKVNDCATRANLLVLSEIDWSRLPRGGRTTPGMPGTNRLDEKMIGATNVRTYFLGDEMVSSKVMEHPRHGLWVPSVVFFEKDGKTNVIYVKTSHKIEELRKAGVMDETKANKVLEFTREYDKKFDNFNNNLKGTRSS
jgi:hypothetical protein